MIFSGCDCDELILLDNAIYNIEAIVGSEVDALPKIRQINRDPIISPKNLQLNNGPNT